MAATISASSSVTNRIYNLSFIHSSISLTTNFPHIPISPKALNITLKSQSFSLYPLSLHRLHPPFAAFDGFEEAHDSTGGSQQDDPEPENIEKPEQEEEQKVSESNDAGRLYVGNLPYSTTSTQLAELFAEAGTVVSAEVETMK